MLTEGISQFDKITIVPNMRAELIGKSRTCLLGLLLVGKHLPPANLPQQKTGIGTEAAASCPYALNAVMQDIPYPC